MEEIKFTICLRNLETGGALSSISLTTERDPPLSNSLHAIYPVSFFVVVVCIGYLFE